MHNTKQTADRHASAREKEKKIASHVGTGRHVRINLTLSNSSLKLQQGGQPCRNSYLHAKEGYIGLSVARSFIMPRGAYYSTTVSIRNAVHILCMLCIIRGVASTTTSS